MYLYRLMNIQTTLLCGGGSLVLSFASLLMVCLTRTHCTLCKDSLGFESYSNIRNRFPTLSPKNLAPKDWKFLPFKFIARTDMDASLLIEAAPSWNFWQFCVTCGLFISGTNTYCIRKRISQMPAVINMNSINSLFLQSPFIIGYRKRGEGGNQNLVSRAHHVDVNWSET